MLTTHNFMKFLTLSVATMAFAPAMAHAEYSALLPGKWEVHAVTEIRGMEGITQMPTVPPRTETTCVTQENLNSQEGIVDKLTGNENYTCSKRNVNVTDARTTWDVACLVKGQNVLSTGEIVPHSNKKSYAGKIHISYELMPGMAPLLSDVTMTGTWKGECDATTPKLEDKLKQTTQGSVAQEAPAQ